MENNEEVVWEMLSIVQFIGPSFLCVPRIYFVQLNKKLSGFEQSRSIFQNTIWSLLDFDVLQDIWSRV